MVFGKQALKRSKKVDFSLRVRLKTIAYKNAQPAIFRDSKDIKALPLNIYFDQQSALVAVLLPSWSILKTAQ